MEIALDIAFQCSPDHPWVREHPDWFRQRPTASIQYAENPPKKYQDIYPLNFEIAEPGASCGRRFRDVFVFWIEHGVKIFRVDNPHTKAFPSGSGASPKSTKTHPGRHLSGRGLHPSARDVLARQARVLPSPTPTSPGATRASRTDRVLRRDHANRRHRLLPSESLAQYARHSARGSSRLAGRPAFTQRARPGRDARRELRHLRTGLRAGRERCPQSPAAKNISTREKYEIRASEPRRAGHPRAS